MAGAGTMTVVQTVAEAHMWPLARDRGPVVQTLAEPQLPAWPHVAEVRGQLGLAWSHGLHRQGGERVTRPGQARLGSCPPYSDFATFQMPGNGSKTQSHASKHENMEPCVKWRTAFVSLHQPLCMITLM